MLKHLLLIDAKTNPQSFPQWSLLDSDGDRVKCFSRYLEVLRSRGYAYQTQLRYVHAAARFIDYLYEEKAIGYPLTNLQINRVIENYIPFLLQGRSFSSIEVEAEKRLRKYADVVGVGGGLCHKSLTPTLAAINLLLRVVQDVAKEAHELVKSSGYSVSYDEPGLVINAIKGRRNLGYLEKKHIVQSTLLGSLIGHAGLSTRSNALALYRRTSSQTTLTNKGFPANRIPDLIQAASCYRDRTLYALLAASGIRLHEALNLTLQDVDLSNRVVYVRDPEERRFGHSHSLDPKKRFKGRATSKVLLIEPYKEIFFKSFAVYFKQERVATADHDFVFQKIEKSSRGNPLKTASYSSLTKSFKKTVLRAGIPQFSEEGTKALTLHSLRHTYGYYLLNEIPHKSGRGLPIEDVQILMGHKEISSTRLYAITDQKRVEQALHEADTFLYKTSIGAD